MPLSAIFQLYQAKIKNKFVSPYPTDPVKISRLKFFLLEICRHFFSFFFSFHSTFVLLKIPYFRFVSPKDRYFHITKLIFVIKTKKTYLPDNSYKPIINAAWVRTRLCKLQKRVHSTRSRK
jgi:hypothetical protein